MALACECIRTTSNKSIVNSILNTIQSCVTLAGPSNCVFYVLNRWVSECEWMNVEKSFAQHQQIYFCHCVWKRMTANSCQVLSLTTTHRINNNSQNFSFTSSFIPNDKWKFVYVLVLWNCSFLLCVLCVLFRGNL